MTIIAFFLGVVLLIFIIVCVGNDDNIQGLGLGTAIGVIVTFIIVILCLNSSEVTNSRAAKDQSFQFIGYKQGQLDALSGHQHYQMEIHYKQDTIINQIDSTTSTVLTPVDTSYLEVKNNNYRIDTIYTVTTITLNHK